MEAPILNVLNLKSPFPRHHANGSSNDPCRLPELELTRCGTLDGERSSLSLLVPKDPPILFPKLVLGQNYPSKRKLGELSLRENFP